MNAIEKQAREIRDLHLSPSDYNYHDVLPAIIAALTPPDGYVLLPVEPTDDEVRVANEAQQRFFDEHTMSMFFSSGHYNEESIRQSLRAVRTARPEVPNVND